MDLSAPKTSGIINVVEDLYCDPTGVIDCYISIMTSIRGLTGPARYYFPPGTFLFLRPVIAGPFGPEFHGAGRRLTTLTSGYGSSKPVLIFGLREVDGANQVTAANCPDAYGKLDATLSGSIGGWTGFRTMGNMMGITQQHPLALGSRPVQSGGLLWTYQSEESSWTFQAALTFDGGWPVSKPLFGMGAAETSDPAPWLLMTTDDGRFSFYFRTSDGGAYQAFFTPPVIDPKAVLRLRIWIDWNTGTLGVAINGKDVPITWSAATLNLTGKRFWRNTGKYPFLIGTDLLKRSIPDFTVWAMRIDALAIKTEPPNDVSRYYNDFTSHATTAFMGGTGPPGRDLDFWLGDRGAGRVQGSVILTPLSLSGGIIGGGVSDMTITGGSPGIMLVQVLEPFAIERVTCTGGIVGIASLPTFGPSYNIRMMDVYVSGSDSGTALNSCGLYSDGLTCQQGGITSFRFFGGNSILRNTFLSFFNSDAETAFDFLPESWGSIVLIDNANIDSESNAFSAAVIRIDQSAYVGSQLVDLRRISISQSGKVPLVKLTGHPTGGPWQMGDFKGQQFTLYSSDYTSVLDVGDGWLGSLDVRNLGNKTITGSGAGQIQTQSTINPVNP
jgi:hypothetical protein